MKNIEIERIRDKKIGKKILKILDEHLLKPQRIKNLNENEIRNYEKSGFVIGQHSLETIEDWIIEDKNYVFIAISSNSKNDNKDVMGFALILGTDEIKQKVNGYGEDVLFKHEKYKEIIMKNNFLYLIQIGVSKKYLNLGIGSKIISEVFTKTNKPIISFVVKNPIKNRASLYFHLLNNFEYFGDYIGEYGEFKNYRSIGLMYIPGNDIKKKRNILEMMDFIYKNNRQRA